MHNSLPLGFSSCFTDNLFFHKKPIHLARIIIPTCGLEVHRRRKEKDHIISMLNNFELCEGNEIPMPMRQP